MLSLAHRHVSFQPTWAWLCSEPKLTDEALERARTMRKLCSERYFNIIKKKSSNQSPFFGEFALRLWTNTRPDSDSDSDGYGGGESKSAPPESPPCYHACAAVGGGGQVNFVGESAFTMLLKNLLKDNTEPDEYILNCVKIMLQGYPEFIPELNTLSTGPGDKTVYDLFADYAERYTKNDKIKDALNNSIGLLVARGALPGKTMAALNENAYKRKETRNKAFALDGKKKNYYQRLFWHLEEEEEEDDSQKVTETFAAMKATTLERDFAKKLLGTTWGFNDKTSLFEMAVVCQNVELSELLVGELNREQLKGVLDKNLSIDTTFTLRDKIKHLSQYADRDDWVLAFEEEKKRIIEDNLKSHPTPKLQEEKSKMDGIITKKEEEEAEQKKKCQEIAKIFGVFEKLDKYVPTDTSGQDKYSDFYVNEMCTTGKWSEIARKVPPAVRSLTRKALTQDQIDNLKLDCLFGFDKMDGTPFQMSPMQKQTLKNTYGRPTGGGIITTSRQGKKTYELTIGKVKEPALRPEQESAGLTFKVDGDERGKYSFSDAKRKWRWVRISPQDSKGNSLNKTKIWRTDVKKESAWLTRKILPYQSAPAERGELVLCNIENNHEKLLDQVEDSGKGFFMDYGLSAMRALRSTAVGGAIGYAGGAYLLGDYALSALPYGEYMAPLATAAVGTLGYYTSLEMGKGSDEYKYCKVVRVFRRPPEEKVGAAGKAEKSAVGGLGGASAGFFGVYYQGTWIPIAQQATNGFWSLLEPESKALEPYIDKDSAFKAFLEYVRAYIKQYPNTTTGVLVAAVLVTSYYFGATLPNKVSSFFSAERFGLDNQSVVNGYVKLNDLEHITTKPREQSQDEVNALKWQIHESLLWRFVREHSSPESSDGFYVPKEEKQEFIAPAEVKERLMRTDFAVKF